MNPALKKISEIQSKKSQNTTKDINDAGGGDDIGDGGSEKPDRRPKTRLIPVPDWKNHHSWPPLGGLRHLIFNEKTNGFKPAFKRVGRRVLVDEAAFFAIVEAQNGGM